MESGGQSYLRSGLSEFLATNKMIGIIAGQGNVESNGRVEVAWRFVHGIEPAAVLDDETAYRMHNDILNIKCTDFYTDLFGQRCSRYRPEPWGIRRKS